jgi:hypothetical protein
MVVAGPYADACELSGTALTMGAWMCPVEPIADDGTAGE